MKQNQKTKLYLSLLVFIIMSFVSYAQNTVSIYNVSTVSLDFISPVMPGYPLNDVSANTSWLNYNLVHTSPEPSYSIAVEISSGAVPAGMELRIEAGTYEGEGGEQYGFPTGQIIVTNEPQIIVNNIGTCNSGSGTNVGHQLTYSFVITNYALLSAGSSTVELLYTIIQ